MPVVDRAALDDFIAGLDRDFALPHSERPEAVRARLGRTLARAGFAAHCAETVLRNGTSPTLYTDRLGRYALKMFCWPPGFGNEPHRHDTWTVAGMLSGALLVTRSAVSAADCLTSPPLSARAGDVGVLIPPQFHCLRNDGTEAAISLHLFSLDPSGIAPDREDGAQGASRFDDEDVVALVHMAVQQVGAAAVGCIEAGFDAVGPAAKLELVKSMLPLDAGRAVGLGRVLSELVGGEDGRRLLRLIERLEAAPGELAVTA